MRDLVTTENAAILPIDDQRGTIKLLDEIVRNTHALARTALVAASPRDLAIQRTLYEEISST